MKRHKAPHVPTTFVAAPIFDSPDLIPGAGAVILDHSRVPGGTKKMPRLDRGLPGHRTGGRLLPTWYLL